MTTTISKTPPDTIKAVPVREYGRWAFLVIFVASLALVVRAFAGADIDYAVTRQFLTAGNVLTGLGNTVVISVLAQALGIALGVLFAILGRSRHREIRAVSGASPRCWASASTRAPIWRRSSVPASTPSTRARPRPPTHSACAAP
jgi:ABC-type Fe3+ transport system permease subunit